MKKVEYDEIRINIMESEQHKNTCFCSISNEYKLPLHAQTCKSTSYKLHVPHRGAMREETSTQKEVQRKREGEETSCAQFHATGQHSSCSIMPSHMPARLSAQHLFRKIARTVVDEQDQEGSQQSDYEQFDKQPLVASADQIFNDFQRIHEAKEGGIRSAGIERKDT